MSRYQAVPWSSGLATPRMCFTVSSTAMRGISSKVVSASPAAPRRCASNSSACCGESIPASAVAVSAGCGKELQGRGGNHAERSLGADEQGFDVVAGIVLAQALEPGQHASVGQHDLEAEHQIAHHAIAQAPRCRPHWSTGCRRFAPCLPIPDSRETADAADRAAACASASVQPASTIMRVVGRVDLAHPVEPAHREHDLRARFVGRRAAAVAGVAAVRHDRHLARDCKSRECGRLDRRCAGRSTSGVDAVVQPPKVDGVGREIARGASSHAPSPTTALRSASVPPSDRPRHRRCNRARASAQRRLPTALADRGRHRLQVPDQAEERQELQHVERDVELPPIEPLTRRGGIVVVVVVPALAEGDDARATRCCGCCRRSCSAGGRRRATAS